MIEEPKHTEIAENADQPATKGDIVAVRLELKGDIDELARSAKASFDRVDRRLDTVESDIATVKSDVAGLKRGQAAILKVVTSIDQQLQQWKDIPEGVERLENAVFPT